MLPSGIAPFRVAVPDAQIADLRERLARTRWPDAETVEDWTQGVPLAYMQELCGYWAEGYDWRRAEAALNAVPQFRAELSGPAIHFLHARSPHPDALPLLITHGWPGSVLEFLGVIGPLVDPEAHGGEARDAFHVVCPSLPGYGFSDKPARPGCGVAEIAALWAELMSALDYERYGAQGGDWGSMVTTALARRDAEHLAGIHLNMLLLSRDEIRRAGEPTEEEQSALAAAAEHRRRGTGYSKQQSTRPQTLGYALADSPTGQCAWIVEKFWAWTDCDGHPERALTRDQMLDMASLYWFTGTATSSARLYWESFRELDAGPIDVPAGCSAFPKEISPFSRRWAEQRFTDLRHFSRPPRGGHFAALEQPALFVDELRAFFRTVR